MGAGSGKTRRTQATDPVPTRSGHDQVFVTGSEVVFVERTAHGGALRKQFLDEYPGADLGEGLGSLYKSGGIDRLHGATGVVKSLQYRDGEVKLYLVEFGSGNTYVLADDELRRPELLGRLSLRDAGLVPVVF